MGPVLTTLHCWLAQLFVQLSCKLFNLLVNHSPAYSPFRLLVKNFIKAGQTVYKPAYSYTGS